MIERAFIGLSILGHSEVLPACARVEPRHITDPTLREIYTQIRSQHASGAFPDEPALIDHLHGGYPLIAEVIEQCVAAATDPLKIEKYADVLLQRYQTESRRRACDEYITQTFDDDPDGGHWRRLQSDLERAEALFQPRNTQEETWAACLEDMAQRMARRREGKQQGIPWGFRELDGLTGGVDRGLHLIGGWSSSGKSSLLTSFLLSAMKHGYRPKVISLDMGTYPFAWRACSHLHEVDLGKFKAGTLTDDDYSCLARTIAHLLASGFIVDAGCTSLEDVKASIVRDRDLADVFVIDYLQKTDTEQRDEASAVRLVMLGLNSIGPAIEHKPIVVLTQFSNSPSKEELAGGKCPVPDINQIRKFKDASRMVESAVFVWRSNQFIENYRGEVEAGLHLVKSQNTAKGFFPVEWLPKFAMFRDFGSQQGELQWD